MSLDRAALVTYTPSERDKAYRTALNHKERERDRQKDRERERERDQRDRERLQREKEKEKKDEQKSQGAVDKLPLLVLLLVVRSLRTPAASGQDKFQWELQEGTSQLQKAVAM
jgi:hypothetical protein